MTSPVGFAVVGAGILGERHARVWRELDDSELCAVVDVDAAKARTVADRYGAGWASDLASVLDDPRIGAVSVATPDHRHRDPVLAALEAGKHVLVEKPLATTTEDARAIVAAAERRDRIVQVNFSQRRLPPYAYLKRVIDAGEIGEPRLVVSVKRDRLHVPTRMISWAASTSPIFFMTSHDLDLIRWYLEAEPVGVSAQETRGVLESKGVAAPDGIQALVRFDSGASAALSSSWIHPDTYPMLAEDRLEIVGSAGVAEYRSREGVLTVHAADSARTVEFPAAATISESGGRLRGAFVDSCRHFLDSLRTGRPPSTAAADSLRAVACQELIHRSAHAGGRYLDLPPALDGDTTSPTTPHQEATRP